MKRFETIAASAALAVIGAGLVRAQSDAPYTDGPVWTITMVKTKPGMSDDYLKTLAKLYKSTNDEMKKQGVIMDYKILIGNDATPQDFDILLMTELKTWPRSMVCGKKPTRIAEQNPRERRRSAAGCDQTDGDSGDYGQQADARSHFEVGHRTRGGFGRSHQIDIVRAQSWLP